MKNFIIWLGCVLILVIGACISAKVYILVDDWEGNIEGAILPFVSSAFCFAFFLMPASFLYGYFIIDKFVDEGEI